MSTRAVAPSPSFFTATPPSPCVREASPAHPVLRKNRQIVSAPLTLSSVHLWTSASVASGPRTKCRSAEVPPGAGELRGDTPTASASTLRSHLKSWTRRQHSPWRLRPSATLGTARPNGTLAAERATPVAAQGQGSSDLVVARFWAGRQSRRFPRRSASATSRTARLSEEKGAARTRAPPCRPAHANTRTMLTPGRAGGPAGRAGGVGMECDPGGESERAHRSCTTSSGFFHTR
jgi:hypothetical protein